MVSADFYTGRKWNTKKSRHDGSASGECISQSLVQNLQSKWAASVRPGLDLETASKTKAQKNHGWLLTSSSAHTWICAYTCKQHACKHTCTSHPHKTMEKKEIAHHKKLMGICWINTWENHLSLYPCRWIMKYIWGGFNWLLSFETGSYCVVHAELKRVILLPQLSSAELESEFWFAYLLIMNCIIKSFILSYL